MRYEERFDGWVSQERLYLNDKISSPADSALYENLWMQPEYPCNDSVQSSTNAIVDGNESGASQRNPLVGEARSSMTKSPPGVTFMVSWKWSLMVVGLSVFILHRWHHKLYTCIPAMFDTDQKRLRWTRIGDRKRFGVAIYFSPIQPIHAYVALHAAPSYPSLPWLSGNLPMETRRVVARELCLSFSHYPKLLLSELL